MWLDLLVAFNLIGSLKVFVDMLHNTKTPIVLIALAVLWVCLSLWFTCRHVAGMFDE